MTRLTCPEVLDQIGLYAAGECEEPGRTAIRTHLESCSACDEAEREMQQFLGLLELRFQEHDRWRRLQTRLDREVRRPAQGGLPFVRRTAAVAAMLILAIGLSFWFRSFAPTGGSGNPIELALLPAERSEVEVLPGEPLAALTKVKPRAAEVPAKPMVFALDLKGKTAAEFRQELERSQDSGRLPAPPPINRDLEFHNRSDQKLHIFIGADQSELLMDLTGPGVVTGVSGESFGAAFLIRNTIELAPGQSDKLPITRLVYGSRKNIRCAYWTQPGEYTLAIRYKAAISPAPRGAPKALLAGHEGENIGFIVLRSAPYRISVQAKP